MLKLRVLQLFSLPDSNIIAKACYIFFFFLIAIHFLHIFFASEVGTGLRFQL